MDQVTMIYYNPKITMRQIKVISCTILAVETHDELSKLQRWICKVFKIEPQRYNRFKAILEYENPLQHSYFFVGSVIQDQWGTKLMIYNIDNLTTIRVMSVDKVKSINKPEFIALIAQTTPEGK